MVVLWVEGSEYIIEARSPQPGRESDDAIVIFGVAGWEVLGSGCTT
jgi:hypothetical protein